MLGRTTWKTNDSRGAWRAMRAAGAILAAIAFAACSNGGGGTPAIPVPPGAPGIAPEGGQPNFGKNSEGGRGNVDRNDRNHGGRSRQTDQRQQGVDSSGRGSRVGGIVGRPGGVDYGDGGGIVPMGGRPGGAGPDQGGPDAQQAPTTIRISERGFDPRTISIDRLLANGQGRQIDRYSYGSSRNQQSLFYSTASEHDLFGLLDQRIRDFEGPERYALNRSFAARFGATKLIYSRETRVAELLVRTNDSSGGLVLRGLIDGRSGAVQETTGYEPDLNGFVTCLDHDGDCTTAFVKLQNGAGQVAYVLTRNSSVVYHMLTTPRTGTNLAYDRFIALFERGSDRRAQANREFDRALNLSLHTTEVFGGVSTFLLSVRGFVSEGQYAPGSLQAVGIEGPLVKEASTSTAYVGTRQANWMAARGSNAQTSSFLADSIGAAVLDRNNGRGAIQLLIPFYDRLGGGAPITAIMAFAAIQPALTGEISL